MRTYAAVSSAVYAKELRDAEYPHVLQSFHYGHQDIFGRLNRPVNRMLDSGAHSAFTKGAQIDLDDYARWCRDMIESTSDPVRVTNLDVIPGSPGKWATQKEINRAAKQSAANAEQLREYGFKVIEVYHVFEPLSVLDAMVERRRPGEVIGLGGLVRRDLANQTRVQFADSAFARLRDLCTWAALPPVHGFGVGMTGMASRYPFASCDASSWLAPARWGYEITADGKFDRKKGRSQKNRTRVYAESNLRKILASWERRERDLPRLWAERGVTILNEEAN